MQEYFFVNPYTTWSFYRLNVMGQKWSFCYSLKMKENANIRHVTTFRSSIIFMLRRALLLRNDRRLDNLVITSRKLRHLRTSILKMMLTPNLKWRH